MLEETPFYAESGGQVGDIGTIVAGDALFEVTNTFKSGGGVILHQGVLRSGELEEGNAVTRRGGRGDPGRHMRNHTAAHLLQAALRQVLGTHVEQAGQLVDSHRMPVRFHPFFRPDDGGARPGGGAGQRLDSGGDSGGYPGDAHRGGPEAGGYGFVWGEIRRHRPGGAAWGEVSAELCGGTHADNTGRLGLFRIVSESSVAAGVRRIEAVTGKNVLRLLDEYHGLMAQAADAMKAAGVEDIARRAAQLTAEYKAVQRKLEQVHEKLASLKVEGLFGDAKEVRGIRVVAAAFTGTGADAIRAMCEHCRGLSKENAVVVLAGIQEDAGSVSFGCYCAPEAVKKGAPCGQHRPGGRGHLRRTGRRTAGYGHGPAARISPGWTTPSTAWTISWKS